MSISFADIRKLQLGGTADATALATILAGGAMTHPMALGLGPAGMLAGAGLAALGGGWIGRRLADVLRLDAFGGSTLEINSSALPSFDPEGIHLGYVVETGEPLVIPISDWMRHAMIVGQSGVGKTVLGEWLMRQQIASGGGLMWIDGKLDWDNLAKLWAICAWCGREDDLLVVNPGDPRRSNTYNPLLDGDADEIASRCISLIPTSESNAGVDFYRQQATNAVGTLVEAIQSLGQVFNFSDLRVLLTSGKALQWLENELKIGSPEQVSFSLFLDQFRAPDRSTGQPKIQLEKLRQVFGGLGSRLAQFGAGSFGRVMNAYSPEVRLKDCVLEGKIVYIMLPTMGKAEAATALGKMVVSDFRSAIAYVQSLPKEKRPKRPFLGFFDEAGSYVTQAWSRMFEQARSARLVMLPAFQTRANLEVLGEELRAMVSGNTLTKIFFKPGEPDTAEWMAEMIGKEMQTQYSVSAASSASRNDAAFTERIWRGKIDSETKSHNVGYNETLKEDYKISPSKLMELGKGECIVTFEGSKVYHVRTPHLSFTPEFLSAIGPFDVAHQRLRFAKGLNLFGNIAKFQQV